MKCKECSSCNVKSITYNGGKATKKYECRDADPPFEIANIDDECSKSSYKDTQKPKVELSCAQCCGNCMHSSRPKKPEDHVAHYDVAKTERWCYKHNFYITRETVCSDFSLESKKGGVPVCKRIFKFNSKLLLLQQLRARIKKLGLLGKAIEIDNSVYKIDELANCVWLMRCKDWWGKYGCKDSETEKHLNIIKKFLDDYEVKNK